MVSKGPAMNSFQSSSGSGGFSGRNYDRWVERQNTGSALSKVQHQYWVTKQAVFRKLGKKDDECIVASDAELDAKLELFKSVQETCADLLCILDKYQDRLCNLSQEENAMGRFLKEYGKADKTRAGKMMVAVGKTMSYSGQQRLALRVPILRLYQEVETFRNRAIEDTLVTVNSMEKTRTEYRASLNWMKNVSQELDPDTYKQLERFREVQGLVRKNKSYFDKLKLDCLQKVDLLAASRCNMFSHALILYQNTLLQFCHKTAKTMSAVSEAFKGYQHYEFSIVKELSGPSKQLAEKTSQEKKQDKQDESEEPDTDKLLFFDAEYHDQEEDKANDTSAGKGGAEGENKGSLENLLECLRGSNPAKAGSKDKSDFDSLLDLDPGSPTRKADGSALDLLTSDPSDKEAVALLEDILGGPPDPSSSTFSADWVAMFGSDAPAVPAAESTLAEGAAYDASANMLDSAPQETSLAAFLPSQLLDLEKSALIPAPATTSPEKAAEGELTTQSPSPAAQGPVKGKKKSKAGSSDHAAWFNLFADLDPLANPDALGKKGAQEDRNC